MQFLFFNPICPTLGYKYIWPSEQCLSCTLHSFMFVYIIIVLCEFNIIQYRSYPIVLLYQRKLLETTPCKNLSLQLLPSYKTISMKKKKQHNTNLKYIYIYRLIDIHFNNKIFKNLRLYLPLCLLWWNKTSRI